MKSTIRVKFDTTYISLGLQTSNGVILVRWPKFYWKINSTKGEFQICPRMDSDNILYVEYLRYNNYKNEIISFLECC